MVATCSDFHFLSVFSGLILSGSETGIMILVSRRVLNKGSDSDGINRIVFPAHSIFKENFEDNIVQNIADEGPLIFSWTYFQRSECLAKLFFGSCLQKTVLRRFIAEIF